MHSVIRLNWFCFSSLFVHLTAAFYLTWCCLFCFYSLPPRSVAGLDKEPDLVHMEARTADGRECLEPMLKKCTLSQEWNGNWNSLCSFCLPIYILIDRKNVGHGVWCETYFYPSTLGENSEAAGLLSVERMGRSTICWTTEQSILLSI